MPYSVAMGCDATADSPASVDLAGTGFSIPPNDFTVTGVPGGATYVTSTDATIVGGGFCGWINGGAFIYFPHDTLDVPFPVVYAGGDGG
jgi:hypothetical protein